MAYITVKQVAMQLLKYIGIRQLAPEDQSSQLESVQPGDLDEVASAITGAMQEVFFSAPEEIREQRSGSALRAPLNTTATATQYSTTISALSGYASWMNGCTIRLAGDDQDNELVNATTLATPYMGATGTGIQATIYNDCINLDPTVDHVKGPVELPNQAPLYPANDRLNFLQWLGVPLITDTSGRAYGSPFFYFYKRTVSRPRAWFCEGYYDSAQGFYQKRLRIGPMPDTTYPVAYRVALSPPRYSAADIDNGDHTTDPGTLIPVPNSWVESILIPVAKQRFTCHPAFKNESAKQEIARQYKAALDIIRESTAVPLQPNRIHYIG